MLKLPTKPLLLFGLIVLFFLGTLVNLLVLQIHWEHPVSNGTEVEVNLPVIHWDDYLELSKKPE